ncbi:MAG: ZIP family metal transporter [Elusimicrobiota bacterium]
MLFSEILIYSLIAGASSLLGTFLVIKKEEWSTRNSVFLISFASGVMLAIAFFHLIPEAAGLYPGAIALVFAGFLVLYLLQQVMMFHACHDEACHVHRMSVLSTIGLTLHSLLDGLAIGVGFEAGAKLGMIMTLAVVLHKIPDGITITGILLHARRERKSVISFSTLVAMATPAGAVISYFFLRGISHDVLGMMLAFMGGSFLYLAAADLLPETHKEHNRANALFFFIGIVLIWIIGRIIH